MTIRTDGLQGLDPGLDAAREGRSFIRFANDQSSLNSATVIAVDPSGSDPGSYLNMEDGKRYIVRMFYYALNTPSDTIRFEMGVTADPSGSGTFTAKTPHFVAATTATSDGSPQGPIVSDPPLVFTLDDGACICMRILTNDAGATVDCGFTGWEEDL